MAFSIKNIFGDRNKKLLKEYEPIVGQVNALETSISALSDEQLKQKRMNLRID